MGFAGALSAVGQPKDHLPLALFAFNIGIKAGQIAFVVIMIWLGWLLKKVLALHSQRVALVPVYLAGGIPTMWWYWHRSRQEQTFFFFGLMAPDKSALQTLSTGTTKPTENPPRSTPPA
jgi:hypothetical protein